jgi:hypothetical protein
MHRRRPVPHSELCPAGFYTYPKLISTIEWDLGSVLCCIDGPNKAQAIILYTPVGIFLSGKQSAGPARIAGNARMHKVSPWN